MYIEDHIQRVSMIVLLNGKMDICKFVVVGFPIVFAAAAGGIGVAGGIDFVCCVWYIVSLFCCCVVLTCVAPCCLVLSGAQISVA
jgi:hypothetical protein